MRHLLEVEPVMQVGLDSDTDVHDSNHHREHDATQLEDAEALACGGRRLEAEDAGQEDDDGFNNR